MKVIIVGGGPAGMIAAIAASGSGNEVHIYEKNEKLGKKLYITGKGRCNLTNISDMKTVMESVVSNPKFMYSAFGVFTNEDIVKLIEDAGCRTKVERGNRVFPESDHSYDVIDALKKSLRANGVRVHLNEEIKGLVIEDGKCTGIRLKNGIVCGEKIIVATGALSYPSTGSTGDGYRWAQTAGHKIVDTVPALVPLETEEDVSAMMGLSLKNVEASIYNEKKLLYSEFGEMLFTHFGVSGPIIISASSYICRKLQNRLRLEIDLKPALDEEKLDARILRDFEKNKNRALKNSLGELLPSSIIGEVMSQSGIDPDKKVNVITKAERLALIHSLKHLTFTIKGTRGWNEAIITQGGISTKEINPKTMESKLVKNLFFAGEVLDVDALTGGFNLQVAWSTGYCAGRSEDGI